MVAAKTDHDCGVCKKRHEVAPAELGGGMVKIPGRLECRALPPVQDTSRHAIFPTVTCEHHCHVHFELDADAVKARKAEADRVSELDAKVAATRHAAAAQPELALEPAAKAVMEAPAPPANGARRARAKSAK
jgi:hypothetical protein